MVYQGMYWCFTINHPRAEEKPLEWVGTAGVTYVVYQLEKGEDGVPHYQGYLELASNKRLAGMKKINPRAHWELRQGTQEQAIAYCKKQATKVDGPWERGSAKQCRPGRRTDIEAAATVAFEEGLASVRQDHAGEYAKYHAGLEKLASAGRQERAMAKRKSQFAVATLRPWQQELVDNLDQEPDDRKIIWIWEETGNVGKTWMAKYLQCHYGAAYLDCSKKADLNYLLKDHEGTVVCFNIVRSMDEAFMGHVYGVAEAIKDDMVISTKYESTAITLGPQHVVVFANIEPDRTKWSQDRYDVVHIANQLALPPPPTLERTPKRARPTPPEPPSRSSNGLGPGRKASYICP